MIGKAAKGISKSASGSTLAAPPRGRGSWEGYMHASATHIQMNNTGYLARSSQKARLTPKVSSNLRIPQLHPLAMARVSSTRIHDLSMSGRSGSSAQRLSSHMRLNNMF